MTFQQHFAELRQRIIFSLIFFIFAFGICYFFSKEIYQFLLQPFIKNFHDDQNHRLIYTSPAEAFISYLKLSFISALFFSFPIFASEFYLFLSPALYKNEKKNILLIFFFAPLLFLFGAAFSYYFILPITFEYFLSFENQGSAANAILPVQLETKISEYLNFVTNLIFGFGVAFELPILLLFLIKVGLLSVNDLKHKRKYWIVIIFVIAAALTPPDVISQISLSVLLISLFEIVILFGKKLNNKT